MLYSPPKPENPDQELGIFQGRLLWVMVTSLFALAIVVRIHNINALGLIPERQYRSALIARAYYFEKTDSIPEWRKQVAFTSKQRAGVFERRKIIAKYCATYLLIDRRNAGQHHLFDQIKSRGELRYADERFNLIKLNGDAGCDSLVRSPM